MTTSAAYNVCNAAAAAGGTTLAATVGTGTGSPASTSPGDTVFVLVGNGAASGQSISAPTDTQGTSYTLVPNSSSGMPASTNQIALYAGVPANPLVSGTDIITGNWASTLAGKFMIVRAASGIQSPTADKSASAHGSSTAPSSGSSGTLSQASEIAVGGICNASGGGTPTGLSFGTGLTVTSGSFLTEFDAVVSATAALSASGTITSANWAAVIGTFTISLPSITTPSLPGVLSGVPYSQQLVVSGGLPAYTFTILSGSLTGSGITLSAGGLLSGTAATAGTYTCNYQVSDGNGNTATKSLTLVVTGSGFTKVQTGSGQTGTGSVAVTLPAASTAGNLLVACLATPTGPFSAPAGWKLAAAAGGGNPVIFGTNAPNWSLETAAGVTGLTSAIQYPTSFKGVTFTEGVPSAWPASAFPSGASIPIANLTPNIPDSGSTTLDAAWTAFLNSAPTGAWILPWHEVNWDETGGGGSATAAQVFAMDAHLLALKNGIRPDIKYGRGYACLAGGTSVLNWVDTGQSFTATHATPAVFTAATNAVANNTPVVLTGASVPGGFAAGRTYYAVGSSGLTFQLAVAIGGAAIASTTTGSGTVLVTPDFYGMDGYQKGGTVTPDGVFGNLYNGILAVNPQAKIAIIETGTPDNGNGTTTGPTFNQWWDQLYTWVAARPNIIAVQTYFTAPSQVQGTGSQPWKDSFATEMNKLSAELAALGTGADSEIWYYPNCPAGITSVTFTGQSGVTCRGGMAEFSTPAGSTQALDKNPGTAGGSGPAATIGPVATQSPNKASDLGVCCFANEFSTNTAGTWTPPAGYTALVSTSTSIINHLLSAYQTGLAPGTQSVTATFSTSSNEVGWAGVLATFKQVFNSPVITTTSPLTPATAGTAYVAPAMTATGGGGTYSWSADSSLPAGLVLGSDGTWSGTPLAAGTFSFNITVTDQNGSSSGPTAFTIVISPVVVTGQPPVFPANPLGTLVELLINGTWTDVTEFVYTRDGIGITGGSVQEGDKPQRAQCTMTFNNRDGRFSPNNVSGAYYPNLQRGIQIRVSISSQSVTSQLYSGYRFWGKVAEWPVLQDSTGNDVYVQITASGPLREIVQGGGKGGALFRYYQNLAQQDALNGTSYAPVAYWPCEEDPDATSIGSGVDGGADMAITGTPVWKSNNSFNGSAPMGCPNKSVWDGVTGSFGTSGDDIFTVPGTYSWVASTSTVQVNCTGGGGGGTKGQEGSSGGNGGGGGEYAGEAAVAVTPGKAYQLTVGQGGAQGDWDTGGSDGSKSTFTGDSKTVTAHAGKGATANGHSGGTSAGGTGSTNTAHFGGGTGGSSNFNQGAGGGGSGGQGGAGGNGANSSFGTPGTGGTAGATGGGKGGKGGDTSVSGQAGRFPGGGGGGGWADNSQHSLGGGGSAGTVELIYQPTQGGTLPPYNILRFLLQVPSWGGNDGAVLARMFSPAPAFITKVDVLYQAPGKIKIKGYTGTGGTTLNFTSSTLTIGDGATVMVSVEASNSGTSAQYILAAIVAGAPGKIGSITTTVANASIANVTEVLVSPNGDITKTCIGHITVQYNLIPLYKVSDAMNGHFGEMGIDRFIRLCAEQALDNAVEFAEQADHWGFNMGTQGWAGTNATLATSMFTHQDPNSPSQDWPVEGTQSLQLTSVASGAFSASSPVGTAGQPVNAGDIVTAGADVIVRTSGGLNDAYIGIAFYTSSGAFISEVDSTPQSVSAGNVTTLKGKATAPATAATFAIVVGDSDSGATSGQIFYLDNVRVSPRMGTQTREAYKDYLDQIKDLEQGMLKEAKQLWGFNYRTRMRLINQTPALILDYSRAQIAGQLQPVQDDKLTVNHVTVKRNEGSRVTVSQQSGQMSTQLPPAGVGKHARVAKVIAEDDAQLLALAAHLLSLGTDISTRYPTITVDMTRPEVANQFTSCGLVDIGDYIQLVNLPFWYPEPTAKQLVIGYTETLSNYEWTITWNCTPENPWEIEANNVRRW